MALIGYARVSTQDQSLQSQLDSLKTAGCELIYQEKESGMSKARTGLIAVLSDLSQGDVLIVYKLDRLSRSLRDLIQIVDLLKEKGIELRVLTQPIDTSTPLGQCFFHIVGAIAELERGMIVERTRAGLDAAKRLGRLGGRPKCIRKETADLARKLINEGAAKTDVARQLNISRASIYRLLQEKLSRSA